MRLALQLALMLWASGCSTRLWTTPAPAPVPLLPSDPRTALVGHWEIEFRVDSAHHGKLEPGAIVRGVLIVTDTTFRYGPDGLKGAANFDLPVSCFRPGPGVFTVALLGDTVRIDFTPDAHHCGLGAKGRLAGDTVNGRWFEPASVGVASTGTLRMIRKRPS